MRYTLMKLAWFTAFAYFTCGCSSMDTIEAQNRWLQRNYPDRATQFNKLPNAQAFFKEDVLAGNIQFGMNVEEVLIASSTYPYGPRRYQGKFWCDKKAVDRCQSDCHICEGMLFLKNQLIFFSGISNPPVVTDIYNNHSNPALFSAPLSLKHQIRH